jgi:VanZ family protein
LKRARIAAALWGGFLFLLTSWPNPPSIAPGGLPIDKVTHFGLYAVEAFLLVRAFAPGGSSAGRFLAVVGAMAVWGMLDEAHQEWIPGRMMDAADLYADVAGAIGGALVGLAISARPRDRRLRRSRPAGSAP